MTTLPTSAPEWRKSSRSGKDTGCVEVNRSHTAFRDSKNVTGPTLSVDIAALVAAVKAGLGQ